ncbi:hypothetical protein [Streptosporangium lutulentum]|uniref:Uncharacterized protein n=1 Tax=Streptosporangium lutulentum TaxID=1461250 RepID=A0ABT9QNG8_9ACTN|nr:hypothetical protein [Streptosporangium lutulentum]MDP9847564.1 hypothetical protein [Streptosporangium lutulentum]
MDMYLVDLSREQRLLTLLLRKIADEGIAAWLRGMELEAGPSKQRGISWI